METTYQEPPLAADAGPERLLTLQEPPDEMRAIPNCLPNAKDFLFLIPLVSNTNILALWGVSEVKGAMIRPRALWFNVAHNKRLTFSNLLLLVITEGRQVFLHLPP